MAKRGRERARRWSRGRRAAATRAILRRAQASERASERSLGAEVVLEGRLRNGEGQVSRSRLRSMKKGGSEREEEFKVDQPLCTDYRQW